MVKPRMKKPRMKKVGTKESKIKKPVANSRILVMKTPIKKKESKVPPKMKNYLLNQFRERGIQLETRIQMERIQKNLAFAKPKYTSEDLRKIEKKSKRWFFPKKLTKEEKAALQVLNYIDILYKEVHNTELKPNEFKQLKFEINYFLKKEDFLWAGYTEKELTKLFS